LKQFIAPFLLDPEAHLAEPVRFELLRSARPKERRQLEAQFATLPTLPARICGSGRSPWARLHPGLAMVRRGICAAPAMADSHLANRSQFKGLRSRCRSILRSLSCPIEGLLRKATVAEQRRWIISALWQVENRAITSYSSMGSEWASFARDTAQKKKLAGQ
jgi:hypothetical protein